MTRTELQALSELRLLEAKALLPISPSGAYYLAGYAPECALKACFIRSRHEEFPERQAQKGDNDPYTHDLVRLVKLARLEAAFGAVRGADPVLNANWNTVVAWNEESRYARRSAQDAHDLIDALDDPDHGVMQWLRTHW